MDTPAAVVAGAIRAHGVCQFRFLREEIQRVLGTEISDTDLLAVLTEKDTYAEVFEHNEVMTQATQRYIFRVVSEELQPTRQAVISQFRSKGQIQKKDIKQALGDRFVEA